MSKTAFVFPGQGTQYPGMIKNYMMNLMIILKN